MSDQPNYCPSCGAEGPPGTGVMVCDRCKKARKTKHLSGRVPIYYHEEIEFLISQKKYKNKTDFLLTAVRNLIKEEAGEAEPKNAEGEEAEEVTEARIYRIVDNILHEKLLGVPNYDV